MNLSRADGDAGDLREPSFARRRLLVLLIYSLLLRSASPPFERLLLFFLPLHRSSAPSLSLSAPGSLSPSQYDDQLPPPETPLAFLTCLNPEYASGSRSLEERSRGLGSSASSRSFGSSALSAAPGADAVKSELAPQPMSLAIHFRSDKRRRSALRQSGVGSTVPAPGVGARSLPAALRSRLTSGRDRSTALLTLQSEGVTVRRLSES